MQSKDLRQSVWEVLVRLVSGASSQQDSNIWWKEACAVKWPSRLEKHQELSSRATGFLQACGPVWPKPLPVQERAQLCPDVGLPQESPARLRGADGGGAQTPGMFCCPKSGAGSPRPPLPGHAAYYSAPLILSHVQDSQACPKQGGNTAAEFKTLSPGSKTKFSLPP